MTDTPTDLTKPVRTRSGLDVRILCTDAPGDFPVRGEFINDEDAAVSRAWAKDGRYLASGLEHPRDLVNVPETTKRYVVLGPYTNGRFINNARDAVMLCKNVGGNSSTIELTYEGDRLSAVRIVEDE